MNPHNEESIHFGVHVATQHDENSGQTFLSNQHQETVERPMSPNETASSTSISPGQPGGKVVKQRAKKTSRARLIEALNRANGVYKAVQPVTSETPEGNLLSASRDRSASEGCAAVAEATAATGPGLNARPPSPQPNNAPQTPALPVLPAGWNLSLRIDGQNFSLVNRVAYIPSKSAEERRRSKIQNFDSAAFDTAIYQQPAAIKPPPKVFIPTRTRRALPSSSEDQRLYLHIDPAIHYSHDRSEDWFKAKALEIESRGGRKAWFGKAVERIRWLRAQATREKRLANGHEPPQRRMDPQPWKYNRPLDFGDVPESQLPDDILQNPNWLKFCAHFRETERIRMLRHREAKRTKQETEEFYKTVMAGMRSSAGL